MEGFAGLAEAGRLDIELRREVGGSERCRPPAGEDRMRKDPLSSTSAPMGADAASEVSPSSGRSTMRGFLSLGGLWRPFLPAEFAHNVGTEGGREIDPIDVAVGNVNGDARAGKGRARFPKLFRDQVIGTGRNAIQFKGAVDYRN